MSGARHVLVAWTVGTQTLAFPCLAFGAFLSLMAKRPENGAWIPMLVILGGTLLIEGGIAFLCGVALRERLRNRLSFSPLVVALASGVGLFGASLLLGALAMAWAWLATGQWEPEWFYPVAACVAACVLGFGSGLGTLVGCRYRPG